MQKSRNVLRRFEILKKIIFKYVSIESTDVYSNNIKESLQLITDIKDAPFIATALAFNCLIWTDDKDFDKQNRIKILKTKDMVKIVN
ncbi:MAG: PIN domain-containing protein [Nanoarchaeota archaeon]